MLKFNKTELLRNTMRNSRIMDPIEMERIREESKRKYKNMNKTDLMKLDGISGLKRNIDESISLSKSENSQNENDKKNKTKKRTFNKC